jgi:hypothetical protein
MQTATATSSTVASTSNESSKNAVVANNAANSNNVQSDSLYFNYFTSSVVFKGEQNNSNLNNNNRSLISKLNSKVKSIEKQKFNSELLKHNKHQLSFKKVNSNDTNLLYTKPLLKQKQLNSEYLLPKLETNNIKKTNINFSELKEATKNLHVNNNNRISSGKTVKTNNTESLNNHNKETHSQPQRVNAILVDLNQQSLEAMTILSNESQKNLYYQILKRQSNSNNNLYAGNTSTTANNNNSSVVYPSKAVYFSNNNLCESSINSFHGAPSVTSSTTSNTTNSSGNTYSTNSNLLGEIKDNILKRHKNSLINRLGLQVIEGARMDMKLMNELNKQQLSNREITKCSLKIKDLDQPYNKSSKKNDDTTFQTQFRLKPLKLKNIELNDESLVNLKNKYKEKIDECSNQNLYNPNNLTSFNYPTNAYHQAQQTPRSRLPKLPDCFGSESISSKNKLSSDSSSTDNQQKGNNSQTNIKEKIHILNNQNNNSTTNINSGNQQIMNNMNSSRTKLANTSKVNFKKTDQMDVIRASNSSGFDISYFTRVESPHKLEKSVPDDYKFYGNSSMYVNKAWFNQQFELYQSNYYDETNSNSNSSS